MLGVQLLALAVLITASLCPMAALGQSESFSVVLLPDTQNYAEKYPETYLAQTKWIAARAKEDNIKFAVHLGDIVQNAHVEEEWEKADAAHRVLDGAVPYSVVPGNHDMDKKDEQLTRGSSLYAKYFPPSRFAKMPGYGGHMGDTNDCNYCFFEGAGMKFMVLSLQFAPSKEMVAWAEGVVNAHKDHRIIVATHYYMRPEGRGVTPSPYGLDGYDGEGLWNAFIRKHENIFMVVSGHVLGIHHQTSKNDAGGDVHEILCDYQGHPNGGDGWLQTLRFVPAENAIHVEAYSPLLDKKNDAPAETYVLTYEMSRGTAE
jgi:Calcineurin-like phosphoesterase